MKIKLQNYILFNEILANTIFDIILFAYKNNLIVEYTAIIRPWLNEASYNLPSQIHSY